MSDLFKLAFPDLKSREQNKDIKSFFSKKIKKETVIYLIAADELTDIKFDPYQIEDFAIQKIMEVDLTNLKKGSQAYRIAQAYRSLGYKVSVQFQAIVKNGQLKDTEIAWRLIARPSKKALVS